MDLHLFLDYLLPEFDHLNNLSSYLKTHRRTILGYHMLTNQLIFLLKCFTIRGASI